ncbi:hypothetical protein KSX_74760 [Ktedonospora formicarum]|uniref:Uncharacterized protein n=1 Tax=Ktedonospora formicarum TaxID=2778364 RepID=A0A8J3I8S6_9CHLR|nr:hypothetical protein KSX_74760 [Ktedonospora formicarum]
MDASLPYFRGQSHAQAYYCHSRIVISSLNRILSYTKNNEQGYYHPQLLIDHVLFYPWLTIAEVSPAETKAPGSRMKKLKNIAIENVAMRRKNIWGTAMSIALWA